MSDSIREEWRSRSSRRQRHADTEQIEPVAAKPVKPKPKSKRIQWIILLCLLCLVVSGIGSFVFFRFFAFTTPRELVGTWQVVDGSMKGATLEFRPNGTAIALTNKPGDTNPTHSTVRVEGKKILLTSRDEKTGKDDTVVQTIIKLTEDELVIRDEDRITYRMTRVRN